MSRLRQWLRAVGRRTQLAMPEAVHAIHAAKAAEQGLQSYPAALGSPDAWILRQGRAARFNRRWYFVSDPVQRHALEQGERAADSIRLAIERECQRHGVSVNFTSCSVAGTKRILL